MLNASGPFSRRVVINPLMDTDSYKLSHHDLYPDEVTVVHSYAESRGGDYPGSIFFGLQPWTRRMSDTRLTMEMVEDWEEFCHAHGFPVPPSRGARSILERHDGHLPLLIRSLDEGIWTPVRTPLVTVQNTDDLLGEENMAWLTSYTETSLLRQTWLGTTIATRIFGIREKVQAEFEHTADDLSGLPFAVLDFSSRGVAGFDHSEIGGAAYLACGFMGSDNVPGVAYTNHYYEDAMSGFSVTATEHSVTTAWGRHRQKEQFLTALRRTAAKFPNGGGILSNVSDTYNVFEMCDLYVECKPEIEASGVTVVVRPDSGKMEAVLPQCIQILATGFGTTKNTKGYHVINGVKVLQGDGVNEHTVTQPYHLAKELGISAQSIMTGSGGGLMMTDLDRDSMKFAFKASAVKTANGWEGTAKDPITDPGKRSKAGRFSVYRTGPGRADIETKIYAGQERIDITDPRDLLKVRYCNGHLSNEQTLADIRANVAQAITQPTA